MLEHYLRPLTATEKQGIESELAAETKRLRGFVRFTSVACILILALGVPSIFWKASANLDLVYLGALVLLVYVGIVLWVYVENRGTSHTRRASLRSALLRDQARVLHCRAAEMVELAEIEDEGAGYLFQVESGLILCLIGQLYYASSAFPSTDFELVEVLAASGETVMFEVRSHGEKLNPSRVVGEHAKEELCRAGRYPEDYDIIDGTLADVEQRLIAGTAVITSMQPAQG